MVQWLPEEAVRTRLLGDDYCPYDVPLVGGIAFFSGVSSSRLHVPICLWACSYPAGGRI
jgi:hypothetical protein